MSMKDFLESMISPMTVRSYKASIKTFEKWYGKDISNLLKEKESGRVLERYFVFLKNTYKGNTPRSRLNPIVQYCRYHKVVPDIKKSLHCNKQIISTDDHVLTVLEARKMYEVADLEGKVIIKTWMLGLRIRDAVHLEWKDFDFTTEETLQEVKILTKKEEIPAHLFIDQEFQKLLKTYIPTLDKDNVYLLQSNKGERYSEKQLLRKLQGLRDRAGIKTNKVYGWHIARDLRLTTGVNLGLNSWGLKIMVGKSTGPSVWDYISHAQLKEQAEMLSRALQMEVIQTNGNGAHKKIEDDIEFLSKVIVKVVRELRGNQYNIPSQGIGLIEQESDEQILKEYLES